MSTKTAVPFVLIEEDWSRLDELAGADDFDFYQIAQPDHWRVNCGGSAFTDGAGNVWFGDAGGSGGSTTSRSYDVPNTTDDYLYNTVRYQQFTYTVGCALGTYSVTLWMIPWGTTTTGQRVADIYLQGTRVEQNLDFHTAGGGVDAPFSRTYDGIVVGTDQKLTIEYRKPSGSWDPLLCCFDVAAAQPGGMYTAGVKFDPLIGVARWGPQGAVELSEILPSPVIVYQGGRPKRHVY